MSETDGSAVGAKKKGGRKKLDPARWTPLHLTLLVTEKAALEQAAEKENETGKQLANLTGPLMGRLLIQEGLRKRGMLK